MRSFIETFYQDTKNSMLKVCLNAIYEKQIQTGGVKWISNNRLQCLKTQNTVSEKLKNSGAIRYLP